MPRNLLHIAGGISIITFLLVSVSCTSPRWVVKDTTAVDKSDYRVLNRDKFLSLKDEVSPENPVMELQVFSKEKYEYAEKVLLQRTIQEYKVRPWVLALGLTGAAISAFAAHTDLLLHSQSSTTKGVLTVSAVLMAATGFFAMEPGEKSKPTGEERFLRKTGVFVQQDTVRVTGTKGEEIRLSLRYGDKQLISGEPRDIVNGSVHIGLGSVLNTLEIRGENPDSVTIDIRYNDSTYHYSYRLSKILQPFASITAPVAELRSSPEEDAANVLAELVQGSQLQILEWRGEGTEEEWYKILYGISENYISRDDAAIIWRTSDFAEQSAVVAVPTIPYGNIDVENNIPILSGVHANARALVATNQNYAAPLTPRSYANRDGRLIQTYLENALGFKAGNIVDFEDVNAADTLFAGIQKIKSAASDSTYLFVYLSGYGIIKRSETENVFELEFLPVREDDTQPPEEAAINLSQLFSELSMIPSDKTIVLADIDFRLPEKGIDISEADLDLHQPLQRLADIITSGNEKSAVLFSSEVLQHSRLYVNKSGEDKKHHLFAYFFAKALQQRKTNMGAIFQFLERNIPYHSRRLHDRSQDPRLFGNPTLQIIPDE